MVVLSPIVEILTDLVQSRGPVRLATKEINNIVQIGLNEKITHLVNRNSTSTLARRSIRTSHTAPRTDPLIRTSSRGMWHAEPGVQCISVTGLMNRRWGAWW